MNVAANVFRGRDFLEEYLDLMATTFPPEAVERKRIAWDWLFSSPFSTEANPTRVLTTGRRGMTTGAVVLLPTEFTIGGVPTPTLMPMTTMIHPDHRGSGLSLLKALFDLGHGGLTISLANSERLTSVYQRLGCEVTPMRHLRRKVYRPGAVLSATKGLPKVLAGVVDAVAGVPIAATALRRPRLKAGERIDAIASFGPEFDEAWAGAAASVSFAQTRTAAFLQWRYVDAPFASYVTFALWRDGRIAGYVVTSMQDGARGRVGRVTDIFAHSGSERDYGLLVARADAQFQAWRCAHAEISFGVTPQLDSAARRNGFLLKKRIRPLCFQHEDPVMRARQMQFVEQMHFCRGDHDEDY